MKTCLFFGAVALLVFNYIEIFAQESGLPDHYPKFLKTGKYGQAFERSAKNFEQSGIKTAGRKTFSKTSFSKTGSSYMSSHGTGNHYPSNIGTSTNMQFLGGCISQPRPPMNSLLRCNPSVGCNATCVAGYRFPDGQTKLTLQCQSGIWKVERPAWLGVSVGQQTDMIPASCEPICEPPCENNGICYEPNRCNCPDNYSGMRCENSRKPCLNYPPLPMNARRTCSTTACTVTCIKGHNFPDGSAIANLKCQDGEWIPSKGDWKILPDCEPTCNPPCQNGGNCLSLNVCQCPQDFRGPQCQYRADACSAKRLSFNGGYNCSGNSEMFRCSIKCPDEIPFEFTPASVYTCTYATGIFEPQPVPQCLFPANMEIIPIGGGKHTFYEATHGSMSEINQDLFNWQKNTQYSTSGAVIESGVKGNRFKNDSNFGNVIPGQHGILEHQLITIQEQLPSPGTCFTWGGAHYKTFDGDTFSALSDCAHTLIRDAADNTFSVVVANSPGCKQPTSENCHRNIFIYVQNKEYTLTQSAPSVPVLMGPGGKRLPIPGQILGLRTNLQGHDVVLTLDSLGLTLRWDTRHLIQIQTTEALWNRTEGLCGRHDGDKSTDLLGKDALKKKSISSFVDSWKVNILGESCSNEPIDTNFCALETVSKTLSAEAHEFCSQLLSDKRFGACHAVMDVSLFLEACQWDYCACAEKDPSECACNTMNVYVRECREKGVKEATLIRWRDDQTCPMKCTGGKIYKPCAPNNGVQPTCGEIPLSDDSETSTPTSCEEGCYCPVGTLLHDGECIEPASCPCRLRGKEFSPGSSVPKECNTCTCESGKWKCTNLECGARCSAIGDPHYQTFDGKRYDFMGQCQYYLVKGDNFSIEATNVPCAGAISQSMNFPVNLAAGLPSCTRAVTIRTTSGHIVRLKQNREVTIDGQDVFRFPQVIGNSGDVVRMASSLFVVVELENGLEIWWDGVTRVYVDAPASFRDKTRGLCGTFNSNQKDDFLTPEGDVEQVVIPFANKWKVDELCEDVKEQHHSKDHPCEVNVHNKQKAEKFCGIIHSELFSKCHWLVDPQPYYEDCLFDMCSCEAKISDCLCGALAAYGAACSALGTGIPWRNHVPECGISCPNGQSYQICGNPCTRTCNDISTRSNCKSTCVEGCNCPEGQALDEKGECIFVGTCPCQHDGVNFPAGYKEIRSATLFQELCTCIDALWQCKPASKEEIAKHPKASDRHTVCNINKNQEFTICEPAVPKTCRNMHETQNMLSSSTIHCRPGCKCKPGFVLKEIGGSGLCIRPTECPCHHGGRSYKDGDTVKNDCNDCTCRQGSWECSTKSCSASCTTWGDSHYTSFDGKDFDFQGQCDYVFAKGSLGKHDGFEVSIQNVPCGTLGITCSKSLTITVASESITLTKDKPIPSYQTLRRMALRQTDLFVIVEIADLGVVVTWDKGTRISVRAEPRWKGRLKGLCGNYNDDQKDDFQTPSGGFSEVSPQVFGDSWRLSPTCPASTSIVAPCEARPERRSWALQKCGLLKSEKFSACHSEVPVEKFVERCVFDACACDQGGDCECMCTALQAYAMECAAKGVYIKWRSQDLCPLQCDERCAQYSPCISTCPLETCDNLLSVTRLGHLCASEPCVEGCAPKPCPEGQVHLNSSSLDCVPRNTCKPICMEIDGVVYSEGDLIEEDDCHRCHCTRSNKVCTGKPCATTTTVAPNDMTVKCQTGWTNWINQDKAKNRAENKKGKKLDIESIPSAILLNTLSSGGRCEPEKMIDIQCRTVEGHIDPKATGLDVECSLERGLVCKADKFKGRRCPDFEIRVLCQCENIVKVPEEKIEHCDVSTPNKEHETDCHAFYHCVPSENGFVLVEKTCGPTMWYNPTTQICDWPDNVVQIRPDCKDLEQNITKKPKISQPPIVDDGHNANLTLCPPGYKYSECGTECHRLCLFYTHAVRQKGLCLTGAACEAGCVSESRELACPPGWLWRDNSTCVQIQDCVCRAHDGTPVRPGTVHHESDCELCQCIDNHYTCDRSACTPLPTTTVPTITTIESIIGTEHMPIVEVPLPPETPAEQCPEERYSRLLAPNAENVISDAAFSASSVLNEAHQPWHARIGAKLPISSAGAWSPVVNDQNQYLQIDLGKVEPVYGVVLLGNPLYDSYVTSFKISYSSDPSGKNFHYAKTKSGVAQLFRGPVDQRIPVQTFLDIPVETRFIRLIPKTWHNDISVRIDLIGCSDLQTTTLSPLTSLPDFKISTTVAPMEEMCDEPMGVDNGLLSDNQILVSSEKVLNIPAHGLKLKGNTIWQPLANTPNEWVKFDFGAPRQLTGVKSRGGPNGWVSAYKVQYSHDDFNWNPIVDDFGNDKLFPANFDQDTVYTNMFNKPIKAQYLKILPKKWTNNIQMCIEPLGCFEPYPTVKAEIEEPEPEQPKQKCQHCPGIEPPASELQSGHCACEGTKYWDGMDCIPRAQCPCTVGLLTYAVGTVFEKEDCSECLCALGGVSQCEPKRCEPCEAGLKSTVTSTCGCMCKPCPIGEILCPTSNICINQTSWCNGIVECPDDEVNCVVTTPEPQVTTVKTVECPVVVCPPGFKIQLKKMDRQEELQKNLSPMFHMYGGRKTKMDKSKMAAKYFGAKGSKISNRIGYTGSKSLPRKPLKDSHSTIKSKQPQICVEFICEPPINVDKCPEPSCPPGYSVVYADDKDMNQQQIETLDEPIICRSYECHPPPVKDDICNITGRNFNTFDGTEYKYDICNHVIARDLHSDDWDVTLVKNCSEICSRDLVIRHGSQVVKMFSDLSIEYNGYRYTAEQTSRIGAKNLAFAVSRMGDTLLFVSNHYGFWIMWNKQGNVKLGVTEKLIGQVDGLCGFYDKDPKNDKRKPDGRQAKTTVQFGDSWLLSEEPSQDCEIRTCPLHVQNIAYKMCQAVKDRLLAPCHHAVEDVDAWINRCLETTCTCLEKAQAGNQTKENEEKCRCDVLETFVVECTTARPSVELEDWRMQMECPASCAAPLVHHDCYRRRCEPSCENLASPDACPALPGLCFPGCYCPAGLVRKKDSCVAPRECRDCECNVLPQLEYVTFDGANFTAAQNCSYLMARDKKRDFEVFVNNAPCPLNTDKMCTEVLNLLYDNHRIEIKRSKNPEDDHQVSIDNIPIPSLPFDNGWATVVRLPAHHVNVLIPKLQLEFRAYFPTLGASLRVPSVTYGSKLEGICGDCDRNPENDIKKPDGHLAKNKDEFIASWRKESDGECVEEKVKECEEVKGPDGKDPCLTLLDADRFGQCHLLLDPSVFLSTCWHDTCGGRSELACSSLETYARGCRAQGLCIDYHTELCPARTCPPDTHYQLCGPPCIPSCDNPAGCSRGLPREGCFCPPGLVLKNNTCVEERECFVCDEEGHYPGDSWQKDACTNCECDAVSKTVKCETKSCPAVDTVCEDGFEAIKVKKSEAECCDKYACVPANTTKKECEEPKPLHCGEDQLRKLEKRPDGCHDYVCQCKPIEECPPLTDQTSSTLPVGMERVLNDSGCCPREQLVCKVEKCPKPPVCPKFHHAEKQPIVKDEQCCPDYKCLPPTDKCLFTKSYIASDSGGERELSPLEQEVIILDENSTIADGPCRHCKCHRLSLDSETLQTSCTVTECPSLTESSSANDYILESVWTRGQCCPSPRKTACKENGVVKSPGEKWPQKNEPCTVLECQKGATDEDDVTISKHIVTCDTKCSPGSEYIEPEPKSGECCGACKQISCVVDGVVHLVDSSWTSEDFCTEYHCVNDNGTILVSRKQVACSKPAEDLLKEFVYEYRPIKGECCGQHVAVACLVGGQAQSIGATWADPTGDPCVTWTCVHAGASGAELQAQKTVQTCNTACRPGWVYAPAGDANECCGECVQVKCVINGTEYLPGDKWASPDGCTTYECERQSDGSLTTSVNQETCPDVSACPTENLWHDACCTRCNLTSRPMQKICEPLPISLEDTVGLVVQLRQQHGRCRNIDPIEGFTECKGQCESGTFFNQKTSTHESVCSCCHATQYTGIPVNLVCVDGYQFKKQVAVPSECSCEPCSSTETGKNASVKRPTKS